MYDFDGFIRRERAIQANASKRGKIIRLMVEEDKKANPNKEYLQRLKEMQDTFLEEMQKIYTGDIEAQKEAFENMPEFLRQIEMIEKERESES